MYLIIFIYFNTAKVTPTKHKKYSIVATVACLGNYIINICIWFNTAKVTTTNKTHKEECEDPIIRNGQT